MDQFMDAIGPVFVIAFWAIVIVGSVMGGARLIKTLLLWKLELRERGLQVDKQELDSRLVLVAPGATLVSRQHVEAGALYVNQFQVMLADIDSRRLPQPVPSSISSTYAPHVIDKRPAMLPAPMVSEEKPPPVPTPTFAHIMAQGILRPGLLLFGIDQAGDPFLDEWKNAYHMAISGKTRSGKTRSVAMFATQMAWQMGAKLAILDPHGDAENSLVDLLSPLGCAMLAEPAIEEKQVLDTIRLVQSIGDARLHKQADKRQPILLLVDEMTKLLNRTAIGKELAPLIEGAAQELAKCNIFLLCSGQIWSASRTGGNSAMRASFASALVHRTDRDQARMLLPSRIAVEVEEYKPGVAMFKDASGDFQQLSVPLITRQDIELVAQTITRRDRAPQTVYALPQVVAGGSASGSDRGSVGGSDSEFLSDSEPEREPVRIDPVIDGARMARVRQMLANKAGINEIIRQVWGVQGKGEPWQRARRELVEIIASIARG